MKTCAKIVILLMALGMGVAARAQTPSDPQLRGPDAGPAQDLAVLRLIRFSSTAKDQLGHVPTGVVGITFAIYKKQEGGAALWSETQNVELDEQGHYSVLLGSTKSEGIPLDLFATGEPRWLGVQVQLRGEVEQPRVLLGSVPYALNAGDAETLGGMPASAFVLAAPNGTVSGTGTSGAATQTGANSNTAGNDMTKTAPARPAVSPSAQPQICLYPVTGWEGSYTLTASASGVPSQSPTGFTVATNVSAAANLNLTSFPPLPSTICVTTLQWYSWIADPNGKGSLNSQGVKPIPPPPAGCGGNDTETYTASGPPLGPPSVAYLTANLSNSTYIVNGLMEVLPYTVTDNGCGMTTTSSHSSFYGLWPGGLMLLSWPSFPLPASPQILTGSATFQGSEQSFGDVVPWTLNFTLTPIYDDCDDCKRNGGQGIPVSSSIGSQNQSLGEDVPIVDTGFNLHYESSRTPGAGGNSVASSDASMIGSWTLSVHHAYDVSSNTLFLGDGRQRNAYQLGAPVLFNGNSLVTSEDGSEVYVFSGSSGQHLQTLRPLTGAIEYQFGYDAAGMLVTVTDANGNVTTIQRDASEHPTAIVSPYGQTTSFSVDTNGFLSQVTDPLGKSATFTNSSTGLLTSRTDENGNSFTYTYDSQGKLTKDADPLGGFTALTRTNAASGFGWTVGETTSMGRTSSYQTTVSAPWVQTSTSTFSKQHTNVWPNGLQATDTKTQQGSQISESATLPDGTSDSDTLGPDPVWGMQVPVTTSRTRTQGNLTMTISESRTATLGTMGDPFSLLTATDTTTINGRTYTSLTSAPSASATYHRTVVDTTPMGRKLTTLLDNQERITRVQVEGLLPNDFGYDLRGRLLAVTQGTRRSTFTYDSDGRLATSTDPLGRKKSFSYDADGRLLSTTLPDGRVIGYQYDANGNLTAVIPPGKSAHNFAYTAVNQMSQYLPPSVSGAGSTAYSYNTDRDLTQITRPDLQTISFGYDTAGRPSSVTAPSETIDYAYDSTTGNLTSAAITGGEALSYGYNGPLPTSSSWTGTVSGSVSLADNNNFWPTSLSINGGNTIAFSYDNDGLVTNAGALTVNRSSLNGLISGTTLGPASDSRTYNSFGELIGYTASYNSVGLYRVSYTRDADGRVSRKTETIGGQTSVYAYSYDLAGRLVGVSQNGTPVSSYTYDSNSNRLSAATASGTVSATYDAQDRLLSYGTTTYTYTANGELASQTAGGQTTSYQYDVLGNLVGVTLPSGKAIGYVVDARNRRVGKMVNGVLMEGFLYDGGRIVAQLNGSNALVSQFIYASSATSPDYIVSGGVTYRIFSDERGSPRLVVNTATGAIAEQITYDEFGNVLSDTNPGFQPFGFAGGLYDQDAKLVRFGARDYDPTTGRWTTKDPILFAGGDSNLYGYALRDPVNLVDETGLDWEWSQSTGQLTYVQADGGRTLVDTGYSGHDAGFNNPNLQDVPNTGPIPQGTYIIQPMQNNTTAKGTSLPDSMRITLPDGGTNLLTLPDGGTRGGFLIHGDNRKGNRSASTGCPILRRSTRRRINNSGDNTLRVVR